MIDAYCVELEQCLHAFQNIQCSTLVKKRYNARQGLITGSVHFDNGCRLEFMELKAADRAAKVKYRYQYMDAQNICLFRYDNAPHHPELPTFPHHKHRGTAVEASLEPALHDVLLEIARHGRQKHEATS